MRTFGLLLFVLCVDSGDDATKNDLDKFQGNWQLISLEREWKADPPEDAKKLTLTIQGDKFVLRKEGAVVSEGTMKVDPSKKPKELEETITTGPNKGKTFRAIYEIDEDQHKVCFAAVGKDRPTAFATQPSDGRVLQVWKRVKRSQTLPLPCRRRL